MRDNNFTDKQKRGIDLVFKIVRKKFPFIVGWEFSEGYEKYDCTLYLDIKIDVQKLGEYVGMVPNEVRTKKFGALLSAFDWGDYKSEKWDEIASKSYNLVVQMKSFINENYDILPEEFKIYYDLGHQSKYVVNLSIDYYLIQ
jgi:hypothetical protein